MSIACAGATMPWPARDASGLDEAPFAGTCRSYRRRETVFRDGDNALNLYLVKSGAVALELFLKDGRRQLAELMLPGDYCGFSIDGLHHETAVAMQPSVLLLLRPSELERMGPICLAVVRQTGLQIARSYEHVLALGRRSAEEKVCLFLMRLARVLGEQPKPATVGSTEIINLHVPLTRGEMGDYLGLSLETVCRTMSSLQKQGLIEIGPHQGDIALLDLDAIRALAG